VTYLPVAMQHNNIAEEVFSMWSAPGLFARQLIVSGNNRTRWCVPWDPTRGYIMRVCSQLRLQSVEAGSNTSTVALRVIEGDEKGIECLEV
jgi:hypothetical protein